MPRRARLNDPGRLPGVDLARGLAVVGMLAAHLLVIPEPWEWSDAATWLGIVDGRSSILFATLAGVSIGIVTGGAAPLARAEMRLARERLVLRAGLLWLIGVLLLLTGVPVYVILPAYGILFLLATFFTGLRARALLVSAAVLALVLPVLQPLWERLPLWSGPGGAEAAALVGWHYPFTVWIVFVLAGLGLARCGLERRRVQVGMLAGGTVLAAIGYGVTAAFTPGLPALAAVWTAAPHSSGLGEVFGSGGFAIAVIGGCLLLCARADGRPGVIGTVLLPLRATGAMPLTAYTLQLVVWGIWASVVLGDPGDLAGFRALEPFWPLTLGTIAFCTFWALVVGRGPLEEATARLSRVAARG